jgi:hypothetical protein
MESMCETTTSYVYMCEIEPLVALVEAAGNRVEEADAAVVGEESTAPLGIHDVVHVQQILARLGPLRRLHSTECNLCKDRV